MIEDAMHNQGGGDNAHAAIDHAAERAKHEAGNAARATEQKAARAEARVDQAVDASAQTAHRVTDKVDDWRECGGVAADNARNRVDDLLDHARNWVREKPVESVAIALAAGWLIGRLLSPRH